MNQFYKNLALWLVISLMMVILFNIFNTPGGKTNFESYSSFLGMVEEGVVQDEGDEIPAVVGGGEVEGSVHNVPVYHEGACRQD